MPEKSSYVQYEPVSIFYMGAHPQKIKVTYGLKSSSACCLYLPLRDLQYTESPLVMKWALLTVNEHIQKLFQIKLMYFKRLDQRVMRAWKPDSIIRADMGTIAI